MFKKIGLPEAGFAAYVRSLLSFAQVPSTNTAVKRYYYSSPPLGLTWTYCTTTGHTKAVLFCRENVKDEVKKSIRVVLQPLGPFAGHPMLLGYMAVEFSLTELVRVLLETSTEILTLEQHTGLSAWDWVNEYEIPGSHVPSNYEHTSKRLSMLSGKVTHIGFRVRTLKEYNSSVLGISEQHTKTVTDAAERHRCKQVEEILCIVAEFIDVRVHKADSLQERLAHQVSGMSTIISQRDTSAMKTVAMVTMVFLPGTFVASFFSMPILSWDAGVNGLVVRRPFWIYWAVTVPLTALVLGVWWARHKLKERRNDGGPTVEPAPLEHTSEHEQPVSPPAKEVAVQPCQLPNGELPV
jgi:hypothetical protein